MSTGVQQLRVTAGGAAITAAAAAALVAESKRLAGKKRKAGDKPASEKVGSRCTAFCSLLQ
jgi:hypothetical protein